MTFKLNKLATLVGVGFGVLATSPAFAAPEGMAQAVRQLSNFGLYQANADGSINRALSTADFVPGSFQVTDNASTNARLNGNLAVASTSVNSLPPSPPVDLAHACISTTGSCAAIGENNYTQNSTVTGTFARSDMALEGVIVAGIPVRPPTDPVTFEAFPGKSSLVSEVQIQGAGSGNSQTTSGTGGSVEFALLTSGRIRIDLMANDWLFAFVNPAVDMFASNSLSFKLTENNITIFEWAPDGSGFARGGTVLSEGVSDGLNSNGTARFGCTLNSTINATTLNAGAPQNYACSGQFSAYTEILQAGTVYNLTFAETTTANGTVVPEPGSLALVGAALAGLGLVRRRRNASVA